MAFTGFTAASVLAELVEKAPKGFLLKESLRGLEKETLRVTPDGNLAQTPHPQGVGASISHPSITTDYAECLMELVTPPLSTPEEVLEHLTELIQFVYEKIGDELLWNASMPAIIKDEEAIPIAQYGKSNLGMMKHIYRIGLGHRYGKIMQTIAGIHYNFSFGAPFWAQLKAHALAKERQAHNSKEEATSKSKQAGAAGAVGDADKDFISDGYFRLIRNVLRYGWIIPYLFGSSPALCASFFEGSLNPPKSLVKFGKNTYIGPQATCLRMSDIGYSNKAQEDVQVRYDSLEAYATDLGTIISTPYPKYKLMGVRNEQGDYTQLNYNILQIENEFYSSIRPKRVNRANERATQALRRGGVQYVEVRSVDVNPLLPLGIDIKEMKFIEAFLFFCILEPSPNLTPEEHKAVRSNNTKVVARGRDPTVKLWDMRRGCERPLSEWALDIFDQLQQIAEMIDADTEAANALDVNTPVAGAPDSGNASALTESLSPSPNYYDAIVELKPRCTDVTLLPSYKQMEILRGEGKDFRDFMLDLSKNLKTYFQTDHQPSESIRARLEQLAAESLECRAKIEESDTLTFDQYLREYFRDDFNYDSPSVLRNYNPYLHYNAEEDFSKVDLDGN